MNLKTATISLCLIVFFTNLTVAQTRLLKIAIIDTGFCAAKSDIPLSTKIKENFDATFSIKEDVCKSGENSPRMHGQKVLDVFLKTYNHKTPIEIYPIIVFDADGLQKMDYWQNAYKQAEKLKIDVILTASGFPHNEKQKKYPKWKIPTFAAAGRIGGAIKSDTILYPQVLTPQKNIFIIGSFSPADDFFAPYLDERLLYKNVIDFYQPDSSKCTKFRGNSYSVAVATGKSLNLCEVKNMRECLLEKVEKMKVENSDELIPTF